jgi:hypothetical protein
MVMTRGENVKDFCECPMETIYEKDDTCQYCREVAFFDDPDYAEFMGFILTNGEWL